MLDVLLDAVLDSLKTLPFLFGAFLLMEAAEKHYGKHMDTILKKSKWGGPLAGSILGCIPQCGFSVIASNLYAGGLSTLRTVLTFSHAVLGSVSIDRSFTISVGSKWKSKFFLKSA